ncbi:hypothetical protein [Alkalicoccobacillus porphyridii]|uniref:DUF2157 domain-containing protein n=1 Tax=Alkalicoccobacillus porphyridii TaxID=2597270 RepID=A0A553ZZB3_9BACI|nr:hypothetical protein [Alkalicoccobacillus porphyridii]TSB46746.1 hypothetical protein FN960_10400 [Alkalicoccobacillus porphyridii]
MERQRKDIIINEIQYWKESKLLPEQQCHYLLALYSEGEETFVKKRNRFHLPFMWVFLSQLCFCLSVLILYFTDFVWPMQIALSTILIFITGLLGYAKRNNLAESALHLMMSSLILFVTSLKLALFLWQGAYLWVLISLFVIGWIIAGYLWRQKIFFVLATFVLIILILLVFFNS